MNKPLSIWKIIVGGIILGTVIHFGLVLHAYLSVKEKIRDSNFGTIIFKDDPSIGALFAFRDKENQIKKRKELNDQITWRFLVNLNVIDWNSSVQDISKKLNDALTPELNNDLIGKSTTLSHVIHVVQNLGLRNDDANFESDLENIIAANLSNGPKAYEHYFDVIRSSKQNYAYRENYLAFLFPRELNPLWGSKSSQGNVINLLFIHTELAQKFDLLPEATPGYAKNESLEPAQVYRQINEYFQRILITIHDDPEVISAKSWFMIVEGPEQFLMYCVFSIGFIILLQNYRKKIEFTEKSKRFSLVLYRWIQIALPSLGFIGTKRGLSEALGRADSIVRAGSPINQSLAVSHVSETMGVAFTSTLVGLVLLMILMIFELFLKYKDESWNE